MELRYNGSGKVYFNDKEYSCDLYLNNKLGGIFLRINVKDKNGLSDFYEVPLEIDFLCGNSNFTFPSENLSPVFLKDGLALFILITTTF